jgi:uncharacterized protein (TIGR00369 family)
VTAELNTDVTVESVAARIRDSFPDDLGVEPVEATEEAFVGRMRVDRRHLHPGGLVHGGAWVGLADTVGAWQTFRRLPTGHDFTTVELKLNVFGAAADGDELIAVAEHLHAGRSTHVVEVRVSKEDRPIANLVITQFVLPPRDD